MSRERERLSQDQEDAQGFGGGGRDGEVIKKEVRLEIDLFHIKNDWTITILPPRLSLLILESPHNNCLHF